MIPNPFPVARYRFAFETDQPIRLHDYAGSALRGAFGHALRKIVCVTGQPACQPCSLNTHHYSTFGRGGDR